MIKCKKNGIRRDRPVQIEIASPCVTDWLCDAKQRLFGQIVLFVKCLYT